MATIKLEDVSKDTLYQHYDADVITIQMPEMKAFEVQTCDEEMKIPIALKLEDNMIIDLLQKFNLIQDDKISNPLTAIDKIKIDNKVKTYQDINNKIVFNLLTYYQFLLKCNYCHNYYIINKNKTCMAIRQCCYNHHRCNEISDNELDQKDIDLIMLHTDVCRQHAIRSLRKHNNDLVEAIIDISSI